jgi:ribonuclease HIII
MPVAAVIAGLTELIKKTDGCVWTVIPIGNEAYNRLMLKFKSVNRLLAWGHARAIENLMTKRDEMNPLPERAISDQFAHDKSTVAKALMALGREIELVQRHRAEADLAVAAASILARNEFVTRLQRLGQQYGIKFPKGAGKEVDAVAKEFFEKHGAAELGKVAKMHFRTSLRAQGLPEPQRIPWRSGKSSNSANEDLGDHSNAE